MSSQEIDLINLGQEWVNEFLHYQDKVPVVNDYNFLQSGNEGFLIRKREHISSKHTPEEELAILKRD